ncbi:hypothetical protein SAMN05421813_12360 [Daejeonella rubra]|uniref:Uncharacterized protein n=1 Tax=Daejeonella rubra TaxID=990371 RepID=A0A1G9W3Y6_9SPHI|nr:hypothetical protein SAMN05421813_12360 [Daejeonella rubra]
MEGLIGNYIKKENGDLTLAIGISVSTFSQP